MTRSSFFRYGAAGLALALGAGVSPAQNTPGSTQSPGSPCGWNNQLRQHRGQFSLVDHPNVGGAGTVAGDAAYKVHDPRVWAWGHPILNYTGFQIPLGVGNPLGAWTVNIPNTELWSATGDDVNGRFPDFAAGTLIDLTAIGPFTIGPGACQTTAAACVLGVFFGALQQPCTPAPTVMGTGPIPPPQTVAPNGVALVLRYPAGTSTSTADYWRNFMTSNETGPNPIAQAGWFDAGTNSFMPFPSPLNNSFTALYFDEPTLLAAKYDVLTPFPPPAGLAPDIGTGGYYPSIGLGDSIGIRMYNLEGAMDAPAHIALVLLSVTPPTPLDLTPFGAPGEFSLFTFDPATFAIFPLFQTSMAMGTPNVAIGAAGPFQTAIWSAPPLLVSAGPTPGSIFYMAGFSVDLSPFRIIPSNTIQVQIQP